MLQLEKGLQFTVNINPLPHLYLHLPDSFTGLTPFISFLQRGFELVAPRAPPAVSIAVVVA